MVCTVAHSILAEVSLGISQMKLSRPPSWYKGMSCHVEISWPTRYTLASEMPFGSTRMLLSMHKFPKKHCTWFR